MSTSISSSRLTGLTLLIAIAFFMEQLDSTIAVTAIHNIANSLSVQATTITMAMAIYLMTLAIFLPVGGWLSKNYGCKPTLLFSIVLFAVGSIGCGLSTNISMFMGSELLQGIGGALMVPVGRLFVIQNSQKEDLARRISILIWPGLVAPIFGPSVGAFITTYYSWHWIFFINVPIALCLLALVFYFLPADNREVTRSDFDWLGFFLSTGTLTLGLGCLDWLSDFGVDSALPWGLLVGSVLFGAMLVTHIKKSLHPIVSVESWIRDDNFKWTLVAGSFCRCAVSGLPILIPLYLQSELGLSLIMSGNIVLVMFVGNFLMKPFTTTILSRFGFKKPLILASIISSLAIIGCSMSMNDIHSIYIMLFLVGAMRSLQFSLYSTLAFSELPKKLLNGANVLNNLSSQIAFSVGIALISVFMSLGGGLPSSSMNSAALPFYGLAFIGLVPLLFLRMIQNNYGNSVR